MLRLEGKLNNVEKIKLTDIIKIENLSNVKIRFNIMIDDNWTPIELFKNGNTDSMLRGQYWNYSKQKSYKDGQTTIGFIKIDPNDDLWLLFHIGKITKDLNIYNGIGYEYEELNAYEKYLGRVVIRYKNTSQNMVRKAESVIDDISIEQILPDTFDNDIFPGYDNVNVSWSELKRVIKKETWKTALYNQKGVYLITDISNGKMYVGSAYGENMILGRWQSYIKTGHGGNVELKKLDFDYIKKNFRYSILEIFKASTEDKRIIERESWWKNILLTRTNGYNAN